MPDDVPCPSLMFRHGARVYLPGDYYDPDEVPADARSKILSFLDDPDFATELNAMRQSAFELAKETDVTTRKRLYEELAVRHWRLGIDRRVPDSVQSIFWCHICDRLGRPPLALVPRTFQRNAVVGYVWSPDAEDRFLPSMGVDWDRTRSERVVLILSPAAMNRKDVMALLESVRATAGKKGPRPEKLMRVIMLAFELADSVTEDGRPAGVADGTWTNVKKSFSSYLQTGEIGGPLVEALITMYGQAHGAVVSETKVRDALKQHHEVFAASYRQD